MWQWQIEILAMDTIIETIDVPQQDDFTKIRAVVGALAAGTAPSELRGTAKLTQRHVRYTLHAARILGWANTEDGLSWHVTGAGEDLLTLEAGSGAEKSWMRRSVAQNPLLKAMVPKLMLDDAPDINTLGEHLMNLTGLSPSTAFRRAMTLLAWRTALMEEQVAVAPVVVEPVVAEPVVAELAPVVVEPVAAKPKKAPKVEETRRPEAQGQMSLF